MRRGETVDPSCGNAPRTCSLAASHASAAWAIAGGGQQGGRAEMML